MSLKSKKDLLRSFQEKVERLEQLLPKPAPLEKTKNEEKFLITKTIEMEDASYEGQVQYGLPHGKGIKKYKDGSTYEGDFVKGMIKGTGEWKKDGD